MKLTYRGVNYEYTPAPVEVREDALAGKYRGAALKFRTRAARVPALQPALDLIYRGVRYRTVAASPAEVNAANELKAPVALFYRGMEYSAGPATQIATEAKPVPVQKSITEQIRELVLQHRHREERRERSVLERFEEAIG